MRILHLGKYYSPFAGGIERFLHELACAQHQAGEQVAAVVHHHRVGRRASHEIVEGVTVTRAGSYGTVLYTPVSPTFGRCLGEAIRRFKPDLLHLHMPNPSVAWALNNPHARRVPWVVHWHADAVASQAGAPVNLAYRFYKPIEQRILSVARKVIVTSEPYLSASDALSAWRPKCVVVPLGLSDTPDPAPSSPSGHHASPDAWPDHHLKLLAVGRLSYYKGFDVLLRALVRAQQVSLCLVGTGRMRGALEKLKGELGLARRVLMLGAVSDDRLAGLFSACDCLCLPSIDRAEAFGVVLLEAMRAAKPVVASDIPGSGVGWVVQANQTGLLVPPGEPDALVAAFAELADKATRREEMGATAKQRFLAHFTINDIAGRVRQVYDQAIR